MSSRLSRRLRVIFLPLALTVISAVGIAEPANDEELYKDVIQYTLDYVKKLEAPCPDCGNTLVGEMIPPSPCRKAYEKVYEKDVIDMRVVFGYNDGLLERDDTVDDRFQRMQFVEQVTSACVPPEDKDIPPIGACGFTRAPDDMDLFTKDIKGPDGKPKRVELRLVASSVMDSDKFNRYEYGRKNEGPYGGMQDQQSAKARSTFETGLSEADVLLYIGHARFGAGPSFEPPKRSGSSIDKKYYLSQKGKKGSSFERIAQLLKDSPTRPKLLGIFACDADTLFGQKLRKIAPRTGLALTKNATYAAAAFAQGFATLDNVLAMRCQADFNYQLDVGYFDKPKIPPIKVENFFPSY